MITDKIIRYDEEFISKFEKLKDIIETEDRPAIHRFLIDNFGFIFKTFQYYAKHYASGESGDLVETDEETKAELIRPLSFRQYRLIESSFSHWQDEEELVIWSIWDFLHDNGRIYEKKIMSSSEVAGCSIVLENVYCCLAREKSFVRPE